MHSPLDVDGALQAAGEFGPMQIVSIAILQLGALPLASQLLLLVFVGRQAVPMCGDASAPAANGTAACDRQLCPFAVAEEREWQSIADEWSLVCERAYMVDMAQSLTMLGNLIGCVLFGPLIDTVGRKPMLVGTLALISLSSVYACVAVGFVDFAAARLVAGIGIGGQGLAAFTLLAEYAPTHLRTGISMGGSSLFAIGIAAMSALALVTGNWRQLTLISALSNGVFVLLFLFIPESVRWLSVAGRTAEARRTLRRIARFNGTGDALERFFDAGAVESKPAGADVAVACGGDGCGENAVLRVRTESLSSEDSFGDGLDNVPLTELIEGKGAKVELALAEAKENARGGVAALRQFLASRVATCMLLALMFNWFTASFTYYGVTMASGHLSSNIHLSVALNGLVEIPGYAVVWLFEHRVGRKHFVVFPFLVASVCLALSAGTASLPMVWPLLAKCAISIAFSMVWQQSAEIMPTRLRSVALGTCSTMARVGGVMAPVVAEADKMHLLPLHLNELGVYAGATALAACLHTYLPETQGKRLPDDVQQMVELRQGAGAQYVRAPVDEHVR